MSNNFKKLNKMIPSQLVVKKNNTVDKRQLRDMALQLLLEDMAVWFPDHCYNIETLDF